MAALGETFGAAWSGQAAEMYERAAVAWPVVSAYFAVAAVVVAAQEPELLGAVPAAEPPVAVESGARGTG